MDILNQDSIRFTPSTTSDGGSNAKTFTAASILLFAEEGKLRLNDPVQRYLPGYPYFNTSVWNLITHSVFGPCWYYQSHAVAVSPDQQLKSEFINLLLIFSCSTLFSQ